MPMLAGGEKKKKNISKTAIDTLIYKMTIYL